MLRVHCLLRFTNEALSRLGAPSTEKKDYANHEGGDTDHTANNATDGAPTKPAIGLWRWRRPRAEFCRSGRRLGGGLCGMLRQSQGRHRRRDSSPCWGLCHSSHLCRWRDDGSLYRTRNCRSLHRTRDRRSLHRTRDNLWHHRLCHGWRRICSWRCSSHCLAEILAVDNGANVVWWTAESHILPSAVDAVGVAWICAGLLEQSMLAQRQRVLGGPLTFSWQRSWPLVMVQMLLGGQQKPISWPAPLIHGEYS
jgi:hypothetical protein